MAVAAEDETGVSFPASAPFGGGGPRDAGAMRRLLTAIVGMLGALSSYLVNLPEARQRSWMVTAMTVRFQIIYFIFNVINLFSTEQWTTMGNFKVRHSIRPSTPLKIRWSHGTLKVRFVYIHIGVWIVLIICDRPDTYNPFEGAGHHIYVSSVIPPLPPRRAKMHGVGGVAVSHLAGLRPASVDDGLRQRAPFLGHTGRRGRRFAV